MKENKRGCIYVTDVFIPAYDHNKEGVLISLLLKAIPHPCLQIETIGSLAKSFEKIFARTIFILSSLKPQWHCLNNFNFQLKSTSNFYHLKDARSASLSLCISLLNIIRQTKKEDSVETIVGTGILRLDGSFEESSVEDSKKNASEKFFSISKQFINSKYCNHVFELDRQLTRFS